MRSVWEEEEEREEESEKNVCACMHVCVWGGGIKKQKLYGILLQLGKKKTTHRYIV